MTRLKSDAPERRKQPPRLITITHSSKQRLLYLYHLQRCAVLSYAPADMLPFSCDAGNYNLDFIYHVVHAHTRYPLHFPKAESSDKSQGDHIDPAFLSSAP